MSLKHCFSGDFPVGPPVTDNGIYRFRCVIWLSSLSQKGGCIWEEH
jgi:hypothetical protein